MKTDQLSQAFFRKSFSETETTGYGFIILLDWNI